MTRVQTTPKAISASVATIAVTFSATPTVGNGIVAILLANRTSLNFSPASTVCTDNQGNTYTLAASQINGITGVGIGIYFCTATTSSGTFTITFAPGGTGTGFQMTAVAIEVDSGLLVDQTITATAFSALPNPGTTAALTGNDVFIVAGHATSTQASITVESVSPAWNQEAEELTASGLPGEMDSRTRTSALGTTQTCNWTLASGAFWAAALAAFKGAAPTTIEKSYAYTDLIGLG